MRQKFFLITTTFIILLGLGYYSYTVYKSPEKEPPQTVLPEEVSRPEVIWASGVVMPARRVELGFPIGGKVVEVAVQEGDEVEEGQLLARLEDSELKATVARAEASVKIARARLAVLKAGPRPQELDAARAAVQEAEAALAAAQAKLALTQARLRDLEAGPSEEEITAARAEMERAFAILKQAQAEYDKIAWAPDAASSPQALALEQATAAYKAAQARYERLIKGPDEETLDAARAEVRAAYAGVKAAEARLAEARARYELLKAGAAEEELQAARSAVEEAEASLAQARAALEKAYLYAPFKGTVGRVWVRENEIVSAGEPIISLGDLSVLHVEITSLQETEVVKVREGQPVVITLEALPDITLPGHIVHISPRASLERGRANYTVIVSLDRIHPLLRWGMRAYISIELEK